MAFGTFKSLDEVALAYQVSVRVAAFVQPTPMPVDERFRADLVRLEALADKFLTDEVEALAGTELCAWVDDLRLRDLQ